MRRFTMLSICLLALATFMVTAAQAQSPHFIKTSASVQNNGNLTVSFKEAGLGSNVNIDYLASANGSATYGCINGGGNHPKATNKETVNGPVSAGGTFSSGQNGTISQSLTIAPPGPGNFSCPGGQTLLLGTVSYSNVSISDNTNSVSEVVGTGTFTVVVNNF
jgi:hypothetical protein